MGNGHFMYEELSITDEDIYQSMGYRSQIPDQCVLDYIDEVRREIRSFCQIRYIYATDETKLSQDNRLNIQGKSFSIGKIISSYLENTSYICAFIATAGKEYEAYILRLRKERDIVKEFVADSIGSVIVETCVNKIGENIGFMSSLNRTLSYSPGYCGWNIKEQKLFFQLFPQESCGVTLNSSYLMSPIKSISGIFGLGKNLKPEPYHCELCTNTNCYKRKI